MVASKLNHRMVAELNPEKNPDIHPKKNPALDPNVTLDIPGLYLFRVDLRPSGFTVPVRSSYALLFSPEAEFTGVLIAAGDDFFNEFTVYNEWVGFWVHAKDRSWLRFDLSCRWTGFTT